MSLGFKATEVATVVAVTALLAYGPSPAAAAEPEGSVPAPESSAAPAEAAVPTTTPAPAEAAVPTDPPAPDETKAPAEVTSEPAPAPAAAQPLEVEAEEPEATDDPAEPEPEAVGLLDLKVLDAVIPIPFGPPLSAFGLPLNILNYNLNGPSRSWFRPGTQYGGEAVALYVNAHVSNVLQIKSRKFGARPVPTGNTGAGSGTNAADVTAAGLHAKAISSRTDTKPTALGHNLPEATAESRIGALVSPYLVADGIETKARVKQRDDGEWETVTEVRFARLNMSGSEYQEDDIAPNTTHVIPGLGKVVLNEQTITRLPGDRYGAKVTAIHITLAVALGGLPVGADIYISSSEAIAYE